MTDPPASRTRAERGNDAGAAAEASVAERLIAAMTARGLTLGVAESLTGGALSARLTEVPGCSQVFRGAVVTYATDLKSQLLGVDADELASTGPVTAAVARAMATGARQLLGVSIGVGTTGEAGPVPATDAPPGTVYVAVADSSGTQVRRLDLSGDRPHVRSATVEAALQLVCSVVGDSR